MHMIVNSPRSEGFSLSYHIVAISVFNRDLEIMKERLLVNDYIKIRFKGVFINTLVVVAAGGVSWHVGPQKMDPLLFGESNFF